MRFASLAAILAFAAPSIANAQSAPPLVPFQGLIDKVSARPSIWQTPATADTMPHSISGDGRYVVFSSWAQDLVPGETSPWENVFIRDRMTGQTQRVSKSNSGMDGDGLSEQGSISADGRHVAFASGSSNLVGGDFNGHWDIFVRDLDLDRTVRVSIATNGLESDADSSWPTISADGRFVAFLTSATTLGVGGYSYQPWQAYVHDRDGNGNGIFDEPNDTTTTVVGVSTIGELADAQINNAVISGDGRFVVFDSAATNLDQVGNPSQSNHAYEHNLVTGVTILVDRSVTGGPSSYGVEYGSVDVSYDGQFVTYSSQSSDIVWFDFAWGTQIFRWDRNGPTTAVVSALPDGTRGDNYSYSPSISADGRYVAFVTYATNLAAPSVPGHGAIVVRDMTDGTFTRADVINGVPFDHWSPSRPALNGEGTAVAFMSDAANASGWYEPNYYKAFVATAFSAAPASASFPLDGGTGSIDVNTLPASGWDVMVMYPAWDWITITSGGGYAAGPRTVEYSVAPNYTGIVRDGIIRVGSTDIAIHQEGDGDTTPPVLTPTVTGVVGGDGWYVSNVTVSWTVEDPDSPVTIDWGCTTANMTSDGQMQPACQATSHGGTSFSRLFINRDTTAPTINITTPAPSLYTAGSAVTVEFNCTDPASGVATCSTPVGTQLDTTPGRHTFTAGSTDRAGNSGLKNVEYLVGTGMCVMPNDSLKAWWRLDGNGDDALARVAAYPVPYNGTQWYVSGVAGQAWQGQATSYLEPNDTSMLLASDGLTVAAWVKPSWSGMPATIVYKPNQYRIARFPDGTLRWAFNQTTGFDWVNTGVVIPGNGTAWTHVAVTYDAGLVSTYVNGRLVHWLQLSGTLTTPPWPQAGLNIGGRGDANEFWWGWLDELQVYTSALPQADIEAIALAGSGTLCAPKSTTLSLSVPATVGFGPTFPITATLRDGDGNPVAGKHVIVYSYVSPTGYSPGGQGAITDAAGQVQINLPMSPDAALGTYAHGASVYWDGDAHYTPSQASSSVTVVRGTPTITWTPPAPITYGTPLDATQLNATANYPGTFAYSPATGAVLGAGTQTLSVTFTPNDLDRLNVTTYSVTLTVNKATPVVTITGGTFTYDGQPHAGIATATGVLGEALSPVQIFYNNYATPPPVNAGSYWVSAYFAGNANYTSRYASNTQLIINKAVPTVTITGGPFTYDTHTHQASVAVRGVGGASLSPYWVYYDGQSALPIWAGTHAVQVWYYGDYNYEAVTVNGTLVINKATPTMTGLSNTTFTYDGQPHGVTGVIVQGVDYSTLTPVVITYNGSTTRPVNAGTYAVEARYDGSTNYNAISRTATLTILQASPTVTWATPAGITYGTALDGTQLNATASVLGTFAYSPAAGTVLGAGSQTLSVTFTPTDTVNYQTKTASVTLTVGKATPIVTWGQPADIVYGTALDGTQLNATATVLGTFTYSPAAGAVLGAGSPTLSVTFTPDDSANYNGASATRTITVTKAPTTISWANPNDIVYGTALDGTQLNATASVPGTLTYSPAAGTVLGAGTQTLSVTFTPDDAANYTGAAASTTVNVTKAPTSVTWAAPADIVYGTALDATQLNATANVPGTFTYSPAAGTVLGAGSPTLSVTFMPDDAANYNGATATVTLVVNKASTSVDWIPPADVVYGTPLGSTQLNATATVPGTFSYSPAADTVLGAGGHTLSVTFTPDDAANYNGATATTTITVTKAPTTVTWTAPGAIVYGTALGAAQLNATANVPGTFIYSPAAGTVLNAGGHLLTVTFEPDDMANYAVGVGNTNITVTTAPLTITANNTAKPYGAPLPAFSATTTGFVNGDSLASLTGSLTFSTSATSASPVGTYSVTPQGVSSPNYTITFANGTLTIASASTVTSVSAAPNPSGLNQAVTFTASVAIVAPGAGSMTGNVQFFDGSTLLGTVPLAGGSASLTTNGFGAGSHTVSASYTGDASFAPSSGNSGFTVNSATASSTTTVTSSVNPSAAGQSVTLTATITGPGTIAGTVQFFDGSVLIGSAAVSGTTARLTTAALAVGGHAITARYLGNATAPPSVSPAFAQYVKPSGANPKTPTTALGASPSPATLGSTVTLTATVTGSGNRPPSGVVTFMVNGTVIGQAAVTTSGSNSAVAAINATGLAHGTHNVEAVYLGDGAYRAGTTSISLVVN